MDREEMQQVNDYQAEVAFNIDTLNKNIGIFASRRVRMETVSLQMTEEIVRLKEVTSLKEDVIMPEILTKLAQEETTLQYSLSAGANINKYSLFDFI
jgi:flagellin-like hook-associated protein FlgL